VVQIFTRGKNVPHLFGSLGYGSDNDRRVATGITAVDGDAAFSLSAGARKVNSPSATNERVPFCHDPDRDPYENTFANLRGSYRMWQGETLALEAFGSHARTDFDGCGNGDRNDQTISGARIVSSSSFTDSWASRLTIGQGRDRLVIHGAFPDRFETRQDQAAWVNEFTVPGGTVLAGFEALRQKVLSDATTFSTTTRDTNSVFAGLNQSFGGQRIEASARRDDDDAFGSRSTGSVGYGLPAWTGGPRVSFTVARGFRAPTFYDLYGPASEFYQPNPALRPERNRSREISIRSEGRSDWRWRATAFDNRIEDLVVYVFPTVLNVNRARIRGAEIAVEGSVAGVRVQASATFQRPRDEDTGLRLQGRAERYGSLDVSRRFGDWTAGLTVYASGERFDSANEAPESRLPAYAVVDARVRYQVTKMVALELSATNLADRRYESAVGYDGARRAVMLNVRFDAF
jgi:vitamin B12 transporter